MEAFSPAQTITRVLKMEVIALRIIRTIVMMIKKVNVFAKLFDS
ncbi:hypothetical protein NW063_04725 [Mycoplasmopsis cynos]|uniref:Uncharacterized protein n=1 Tax=Mycoplasmopsis cynos (strain C142) TaxID=1246955 RepID=L0RWC2_MYCC1|nr:hypothetical protein [Mycoplasmopsis cynos]UWV77125.1 hypothetical protein NW070_05160 [Mycoplasmopsis cynos]UWV86099.1 hypothetical protein NW063_04725 [Mycoplasmopsis cynos]CCP23865.1 Hypothetical protein MCYN_0133 [Mycoplasmopsis cynos C142]